MLIFVGVGVSLVLIEILLRLSGFVYMSLQEHRNYLSMKQRGHYRILCIGESTTQGGDWAWPHQLEQVLNERSLGIRFSVINAGVAGITTDGLAERLPREIDRYKPNMVLAMMGVNDNSLEWSEAARPFIKKSFFSQLRTFKLLQLLRLNALAKTRKLFYGKVENRYDEGKTAACDTTRFPRGSDALQPSTGRAETLASGDQAKQGYFDLANKLHVDGLYAEAIPSYQKAIEIDPLFFDAYIGMGWSYVCGGMREQAMVTFQKVIAMDKTNYKAYRALAHIYASQHRGAEVIHIFEKLIKQQPLDNVACVQLADAYISEGKYIQAEETLKSCIARDAKNDRARGLLASMYEIQGKQELSKQYYEEANDIREGYYFPETRENFIRIKQMLDERKIAFVCIQYPMRSVKALMKTVEGQDNITFVDNEAIFKNAVKKEGYDAFFSDTFGGDFGHCTQKGNRLLAESVAKTLVEKKFGK